MVVAICVVIVRGGADFDRGVVVYVIVIDAVFLMSIAEALSIRTGTTITNTTSAARPTFA